MKIIYVANVRIPTEKAHGIQIMKMCQSFILAGVELELIIPWRFNKIKKDPFQYYGIKNQFKIRKLPSLDLIPLGLPKIGFWIQSISFALFSSFYLFFKKSDFIYSRDLSSLLFRKNFVFESHYLPQNIRLYKKLLKRAKVIIVITQKLKELYVENGINPEKILVAPDGVDLVDFNINISKQEARQKLNLPLDKKIVIYAGLFDDWKGYSILLEASIFFDSAEIKLVMIGGTEKQVKDLKKEYPEVIFWGYLPYTSLPINQKAADVLVIPNSAKADISKYYTSPLKLFAHMASKRPIVASDLPSIREILNGQNAVLVESDNPRALADGIKKVLADENLAQKISQKAFQDIGQYTWQKRVEKIIKFINKHE